MCASIFVALYYNTNAHLEKENYKSKKVIRYQKE